MAKTREYEAYVWDAEYNQYVYVGGTASARIYYDTTEGWNAQPDLLSKLNAIYIYTDGSTKLDVHGDAYNIPWMKIGDGRAYVVDLPFVNAEIHDIKRDMEEMQALVKDHINDNVRHISTYDRQVWNEKCRVDETQVTNHENLIFNY